MGPVVDPKQKDRVLSYLRRGEQEGVSFLLPGGEAQVPAYGGGFYVKPGLLTGSPGNVCGQEEIFGPVAYMMPFKSEDDVVALVNRSSLA